MPLSLKLAAPLVAAVLALTSGAAHAEAVAVADGGTHQRLDGVWADIQRIYGYLSTTHDQTIKSQLTKATEQLQRLQDQLDWMDQQGVKLTDQQAEAYKPEAEAALKLILDEVKKTQGVHFTAAEVAEKFKHHYPEYTEDTVNAVLEMEDPTKEFEARYERAAEALQLSVRQTLEHYGMVSKNWQTDAANLDKLISVSDGTTGLLNAIQAGNRISAMTAQSMQQFQLSLAQMVNLQANHIAFIKQREDDVALERKVAKKVAAEAEKRAKASAEKLDELLLGGDNKLPPLAPAGAQAYKRKAN